MTRHLQLVLALAAVVYVCGFALWYSTTPLGLAPVLDGKENLELARTWAEDGIPAEPFYRAPLYPAILTLFIVAGAPIDDLPLLARALNGLAHLVSALLVGFLSRRIWGTVTAAWTGALITAIYPVALHFAADPLDITLGTTFFLGALLCVYPTAQGRPTTATRAFGAGVLIAMAALTRPHFLVMLPLIPLFAVFPAQRWRAPTLGVIGLILPIAVFAATNWHLSQQWVLLPTQGSYNLWAANKPGAHGKYLEQSVTIHHDGMHRNPTRVEASELFERAIGRPPHSDDELNAYWRDRLLESLRQHPALHLQQAVRKLYFLINNTEQYNNKTYAFHKHLSPWLRFNPLGWSLLLFAAGMALILGRPQAPRWPLVLTALIYAAGVAIFFVSARFRLPLAPLMAVAAAGWATVPFADLYRRGRTAFRPGQWLAAAAVVALVAISLTQFRGVADRRTVLQDHILIAQAAAEIGADAISYHESGLALDIDPHSPAAVELHLLSWFNLVIAGEIPLPDQQQTAAALQLASRLHAPPAAVRAVIACCMFRLGRANEATAIWRQLIATSGNDSTLPQLALTLAGGSDGLDSLPPDILDSNEVRTLRQFLSP